MTKPHQRLGKVGDKFVYGIRQVQVLNNGLQSAVGDCREAANSDDARDKYLVEYSSEFDPALAETIGSMEDDVHALIQQVNVKAKTLEAAFPQLESCLNDKKGFSGRLQAARKLEGVIADQFEGVTKMDPHAQHHLLGMSAGEDILGFAKRNEESTKLPDKLTRR